MSKGSTNSRIYWICILVASLTGMVLIFVYTNEAYANDAISINFDTNYLEWNNTFPAISFCMLRPTNPDSKYKIEQFVRKYYEEKNIEEPDEY